MVAAAFVTEARGALLPEGRLAGPMPWVIGIMTFLMILAAAGGIGLGRAAKGLGTNLSNRITVQIVEANADTREKQAGAAVQELERLSRVASVTRVDDRRMAALLEPWLGRDLGSGEIPIPALIDVVLKPGADALPAVVAALKPVAPSARVEAHAQWLGQISGLLQLLRVLAILLIALMGAATAAAVVLAARAALNTHRATIDVMHLMGATDSQIARLFERRAARDALIGSVAGGIVGIGAVLLVGHELAAIGAALLAEGGLDGFAWAILAALPLAAVALTIITVRLTVVRALAGAL